MALTLTSEYKIYVEGTKIFVTDKTGEYAAVTNIGGWGAPNQELAESCLVCLVIRKASTGDQLFTPISPTVAFVYDNAALNSDEKTFEIQFNLDGVLDVVLVRLPVSLDEINYVDTGVVTEGDYYYHDGDIYTYTSGVGVIVTDLLDLVTAASPGLIRDICNDVSTPLLAIQSQLMYKEYALEREKDCDEAEPLFQEILKLQEDIRGVYYTFWSALTVKAQNQIEDLLDKYEIIGN